MTKTERQELWEATRAKIISSPEYKDATPQQLKILEYVMDGSIRSEIIEIFIQEEAQKPPSKTKFQSKKIPTHLPLTSTVFLQKLTRPKKLG